MSDSAKKSPWVHIIVTVLLLAAGSLVGFRGAEAAPRLSIAEAVKRGAPEAVVRLRGRVESLDPATPPDLNEARPAAYYQLRLHRHWIEPYFEKKLDKSRLEKSWDHASSVNLVDDSGAILIDVREAFDERHGEAELPVVQERHLPDKNQRLRIGRIDHDAEPEFEDEYWTTERRWLPVGAEVEAVGVVIQGPNGPELSGPRDGGKLKLRVASGEGEKDEAPASLPPWLGFGLLGLGALSLVALLIRWPRGSSA